MPACIDIFKKDPEAYLKRCGSKGWFRKKALEGTSGILSKKLNLFLKGNQQVAL